MSIYYTHRPEGMDEFLEPFLKSYGGTLVDPMVVGLHKGFRTWKTDLILSTEEPAVEAVDLVSICIYQLAEWFYTHDSVVRIDISDNAAGGTTRVLGRHGMAIVNYQTMVDNLAGVWLATEEERENASSLFIENWVNLDLNKSI